VAGAATVCEQPTVTTSPAPIRQRKREHQHSAEAGKSLRALSDSAKLGFRHTDIMPCHAAEQSNNPAKRRRAGMLFEGEVVQHYAG
jgi:hypothetical protein